jgi:hypothetical protein
MTKDVQCMKYEKEQQKSREVSEIVSSFDPSILQELRAEIVAARRHREAMKDSADAKEAASDSQRDATSAQDAVSDAKNDVRFVISKLRKEIGAAKASADAAKAAADEPQAADSAEAPTQECLMSEATADVVIGCPTSSVAQANLTIKINFNILPSFSSSNIFTIYLHAFCNHSIHSRKTAFKISREISTRITRIRTRSSDGVSARYPISFH